MHTLTTTIEQSKHLLELELDPNTADMWWSNRFVYWQPTPMIGIASEQNQLYTFKWCEMDVPAWSLSALLEVMPPFIKGHHLKIEKTRITDMWYLDYQYLTDSEPRKDLLIAAYEMVCYLLRNNLIKKGDNDGNTSKS